jgi:aspartate/methionine/tyrosine aminotransferase
MRRFPTSDIISLVSGEAPRYDLSESYGPHARLGDVVGDGLAELAEIELSYGTVQGDERVRRIVGELHGVNTADVVLTSGGMQALFLLGYILCRPGDEAVIGTPVFPLARNALESVGAEIRTVPAVFDDGYCVESEAVRAVLTPKTKLVSLATPQNPSGVAVSLQTIREIADAMAAICPAAYLIVDETYREAAYDVDCRVESAIGLGPKIVSVASLSKCHGTPGLRVGWVITRDAELRNQIVTGKFNTTISGSALDEAVALRVLRRHAQIIGATRRKLVDRLAVTANWVSSQGELIEWVRPDAGALCCVRLRKDRYGSGAARQFYAELATLGVRVSLGEWFGDEAGVFRLGFGFLDETNLVAALGHVSTALRLSAGS